MVSDADTNAENPSTNSMSEGHSTDSTAPPPWEQDYGTLVNALIGGVAGIVLGFLPGAPVLGGAIAAYLERGERRDGLAVGGIAGVVMLVPFTLVLYFILIAVGVGGAPIWFGLLGIGIVVLSALYTVGLSVLGGYLGWYVRTEF